MLKGKLSFLKIISALIFMIAALLLFSGCQRDKTADIPPADGYDSDESIAPTDGDDPEANTSPVVGNNMKQEYTFVEYEGYRQNIASFLACGTNGRLDRIYENEKVENIPVPASGKDLTQVLVRPEVTLVSGLSGIILYSHDGEEFQAGKGVKNADVLGLAYFNGKYFACTQNGAILESDDGSTWKNNVKLSNEAIISIAGGKEYIMAITAATDIFISEDGSTWRSENFNVAYDGYYEKYVFSRIIGMNYALTILGYSESDSGNPIIMFSDSGGEVWMFRALSLINDQYPEEFFPLTVYSMGVFGDELMAACSDGRVLAMPDCSKCNQITKVADVELRGIAFSSHKVLVVGDDYEFVFRDAADLQYIKYEDEYLY